MRTRSLVLEMAYMMTARNRMTSRAGEWDHRLDYMIGQRLSGS
jgi:hypothetical protein